MKKAIFAFMLLVAAVTALSAQLPVNLYGRAAFCCGDSPVGGPCLGEFLRERGRNLGRLRETAHRFRLLGSPVRPDLRCGAGERRGGIGGGGLRLHSCPLSLPCGLGGGVVPQTRCPLCLRGPRGLRSVCVHLPCLAKAFLGLVHRPASIARRLHCGLHHTKLSGEGCPRDR